MLLITSLDEIPKIESPCGLTIGNFDGVHLGHQALIQHLRSQLPPDAILTALTFSNHPSHVFSPNSPIPLIYPPIQKVKHLFDCGVDLVVLVPFDLTFAQTPFDQFLFQLKKQLNFSWLTLGEGATFGKGREGNETTVKNLSKTLDFTAEYRPKTSLYHHTISSGQIRALIQQGLFSQASARLGRAYALQAKCIKKEGRLFCPFPGICLPPEGEHQVTLTEKQETLLEKALASVSHQEEGLYLNNSIINNLFEKEVLIAF